MLTAGAAGGIVFNERSTNVVETDQSGQMRTCHNIHKLTTGDLYNRVLEYENSHKSHCNDAINYLNNTAAGISGFYIDSDSCDQAAYVNNATMATWISGANQREAKHEGSEWDNRRPGKDGYDSSFTLLVKSCTAWE